jgi:hypothetical protein
VPALISRLEASIAQAKPKKQPKGRASAAKNIPASKNSPMSKNSPVAKNSPASKNSEADRLRREEALYQALEPIPAAQAEAAAAAGRAWAAAAVRLKRDAEAAPDEGPPSISGSARDAAADEKRVVAWLARGAAPVGEGGGGVGGRIGGRICEMAAFGCR